MWITNSICCWKSIKASQQMFVPNNVKSFGSTYYEFKVNDCSYVQVLSVEQTQWKYLDKPSHRCTHEKHPNTTACIAGFVQSQVKCNVNILGGNSDFQNATCSREQEKKFVNVSMQLEMAEDTLIYEMTGCLSACHKKKYGITRRSETILKDTKTCSARVQ